MKLQKLRHLIKKAKQDSLGISLIWNLQKQSFTDVGLQSCDFIEKRHQHRCFPVSIAKFLRTAFSIEYLWLLLLSFLQNLLKITVKKIISQSRFSHKFLRNNFLEGVHTRSSWDETRSGTKSSLSMVKCLLLLTRFCRDEISSRDEITPVKKTDEISSRDEKKEKKTCKHFIPG